jgi:hypothetical protein
MFAAFLLWPCHTNPHLLLLGESISLAQKVPCFKKKFIIRLWVQLGGRALAVHVLKLSVQSPKPHKKKKKSIALNSKELYFPE